MLNQKIQDAINEQVTAEFYSAYLYMAMSAQFEEMNLKGMASWMQMQAKEELAHGMGLYNYVVERGGRGQMNAIEAPSKEWDSPLAIFEAAYEHELKVSALINGIVDLAIQEKDHATNNFMQWYVKEQVEEEASADEVVQKLKMVKDQPGGLYMVDNELGARTFTMPSILAAKE